MYKKLFLAAVAGMICNLRLSAAQKSISEVEQKTQSAVQIYDAAATEMMWLILRLSMFDSKFSHTRLCLLQTLFKESTPDITSLHPNSKETALIFAIQCCGSEIAQFLINHGANINQPNKYGDTPLSEAIFRNNITLVKFLIMHKATINTHDFRSNFTPFMCAAMGGNSEIIQILIAHGADQTKKDYDGKNARYYARKFGHEEVYLKAVTAGEAELKKSLEEA